MAVSAGNIIVLMPLAIVYLPTNELTLWLLFSTFMSLSILADLGFTPTTTRAYSIALSGAETLKDVGGGNGAGDYKKNTNWGLVNHITNSMRPLYLYVAMGATLLFALVGTIALWQPVSKVDFHFIAWCAWTVILISLFILLYGNPGIAYLRALGKIPVAIMNGER